MCVNWQGTTSFFTAFSEWNVEELVKSATFLSPIAFLNHATTRPCVLAAHSYAAEVCTFRFRSSKINPILLKLFQSFDLLTRINMIDAKMLYAEVQARLRVSNQSVP